MAVTNHACSLLSGGEGEEGTLVDRRLMASLWLSYFETKGKRKQ